MSSHTYEVSGVIYDTSSGQPLSNFKDNNKDFNSDLEWGNTAFRFEPGFIAKPNGEGGGLIKKGGGGVRQYYTGVNKTTGEVTVYRRGQFGLQDDPIGTYDNDGTFKPAENKNGIEFGTEAELEYFKNEENSKFVRDEAVKIATDQWEKSGDSEGGLYSDPYNTVFRKDRPEESEFDNLSSEDVDALLNAEMNARKKYRKDLEFPIGITDLFQDKLKITVLKFEPAEFGGSIDIDKMKVNRFATKIGIFMQKTVSSTTIEGGSPFIQKRKPLSDREILGGVVLPIPDGVTDANAVKFGEGTMNPLQMAASNIALKTLLNEGSMTGGEAAADVFKTAATSGDMAPALSNLLVGSAIGKDADDLLARTRGKIFNNNLQLLFTGPTLRPFNFQYDISPRNQKESDEVLRIIRMFKQSMAVQRDDVGIFLGSPNTYRLEFLDPTLSTHSFLPMIKECALLSFSVNYMPTNSYMTYGDSSMVVYRLNFSFRELDPLFNDDYENMEGEDVQDTEIGF